MQIRGIRGNKLNGVHHGHVKLKNTLKATTITISENYYIDWMCPQEFPHTGALFISVVHADDALNRKTITDNYNFQAIAKLIAKSHQQKESFNMGFKGAKADLAMSMSETIQKHNRVLMVSIHNNPMQIECGRLFLRRLNNGNIFQLRFGYDFTSTSFLNYTSEIVSFDTNCISKKFMSVEADYSYIDKNGSVQVSRETDTTCLAEQGSFTGNVHWVVQPTFVEEKNKSKTAVGLGARLVLTVDGLNNNEKIISANVDFMSVLNFGLKIDSTFLDIASDALPL